MVNSPVYIAGVGISHLDKDGSESSIDDLAISAGTKALLDAGITYSDVNYSIACYLQDDLKVTKDSFKKYGQTGAPVIEVDCYSGLFSAWHGIRSDTANCSLMIGFDTVFERAKCPSETTNDLRRKVARRLRKENITGG